MYAFALIWVPWILISVGIVAHLRSRTNFVLDPCARVGVVVFLQVNYSWNKDYANWIKVIEWHLFNLFPCNPTKAKKKKKIDRWRIHWWNSVIIIKNKVCCKKDILLMSILLEFPFAIVQGAYLTSLKPTGNAMEVEGMLKYFR